MAKITKVSAKATKSHSNSWLLWVGGAAVLVIGILVVIAVINQTQAKPIATIKTFERPVQGHTTDAVVYDQTPPVGGRHDPVWQNCGVYDQPIRSENAVHAMEHGAVWVTYRPDLSADGLALLRQLASGRRYLLLSPYPDLPAPIVASAWGVQVQVDHADDEQLANFITQYMQGSQTPEPGAPCTGGIGTPLG